MRCLLFALLVCLLGGCTKKVIVIVQDPSDAPPGAHIVQVPAEDPGTIAEIDAARKLSFDFSRQDVLTRIARREPLSPSVQPHLVDAAMGLSFDHGRVQILKALIANPYFANAGKIRVLETLDRLSFDHAKQDVLRAIDRRGMLAY